VKTTLTLAIAAVLFAACASGAKQTPQGTTSAATTAEDHEAHHAADAAPAKPESSSPTGEMKGGMGQGMMGKMDMAQMKGMMDQCMSMHKDGKMCDHEAMKSCETKMKKGECNEMMKHAKNSEKPAGKHEH
jgi:hypothetical protein